MGDAIIVTALVAGIVGYFYLKSGDQRRRLEVLHAERLAAMDKGIPLPELPIDPPPADRRESDRNVSLMIGIVLAMFGVGTMIAFRMIEPFRWAWPIPLPMAFMGAGLVLHYILTREGGSPSSSHRGH
jgi:hypothetical protein